MRSRHLIFSAAVIAAACDSPPRSSDGPKAPLTEPVRVSADGPASPAGPAVPRAEGAFDASAWSSAVGAGGGGRYGGRAGPIRARTADTESYAEVPASGFFDVNTSPLSTFAADVDSASFTNAGRILNGGERPPVAAIRLEEFVNACRYDLPPPAGRRTFAIESEVAACPWNQAHELVRFSMSTRPIDKEKLPPCNFVFLIDVSGSMSSANKLGLFQKASDLLIDQLRPQDRVSIVTYASGVRVPLDSVSGDERGKIREAIQSLRTSGGTNGQGGIQAAYELAKKNKVQGINRVLLATDGDFNVGIRDADDLETFIQARKDDGVFLTVLGFGGGNLRDDRLERLANRGNGNYHYVDSLHTARRVLVEEFGAEMMTVAKDVKLQAEFNQDLVKRYRLLGYENRAIAAQDFRDDKKDGGEMGAGHDVTVLYEIERTGNPVTQKTQLARLSVRYKPAEGDTSKEVGKALIAPKVTRQQLSANGKIAAAAAALGMLLRDDEHMGALTTEVLSQLTQQLDPARNPELIALAQAAAAVLEQEREDAQAVIEPLFEEPGGGER